MSATASVVCVAATVVMCEQCADAVEFIQIGRCTHCSRRRCLHLLTVYSGTDLCQECDASAQARAAREGVKP